MSASSAICSVKLDGKSVATSISVFVQESQTSCTIFGEMPPGQTFNCLVQTSVGEFSPSKSFQIDGAARVTARLQVFLFLVLFVKILAHAHFADAVNDVSFTMAATLGFLSSVAISPNAQMQVPQMGFCGSARTASKNVYAAATTALAGQSLSSWQVASGVVFPVIES